MFEIADTRIDFGPGLCPTAEWERFSTDPEIPADLTVSWKFRAEEFYQVEVPEPSSCGRILKYGAGILFADEAWKRAEIYAKTYEEASPLLILMLCAYLAGRGGMLLHSSLVDYQGNGILFVGPSGIGKTTQAELWHQHLGAEILNGDLVFVRERPEGFFGCGSPWHGSSPYCKHAKVSIRALVILDQAKENCLTRASAFQGLGKIMEQLYLPSWDRAATESCLVSLDKLLNQVPVYHLSCLPDADAVFLLQKELGLS